ncbi:hypothetical protein [Thermomonospora umbrina]|uniref:Uncharacterized protein n=1 Tax=Thermomonospora umbrina TaxID=111806 RepID=A0A3D9SQ21_9ACTN|nr:hypothetical protein [Thermomonospora umbrina]REE95035.1 hypothetical protein DFJ69_0408 [Thermomonospora umbrina]
MSRLKTSGRIAGVVAAATLGATVINPGIANAATAVRSFPSPGVVKFQANDTTSGSKVRARITVTITTQGQWVLSTHVYNGHLAWRNVTVECTVGPGWHGSTTFRSPRFRVGGHDHKDAHWSGQDNQVKLDYAYYVGANGYGTCDVHTG